jgi:hypothetical protein
MARLKLRSEKLEVKRGKGTKEQRDKVEIRIDRD